MTITPGEANAQEQTRRTTIREHAQTAFWAVVAAARPDCTSGDLGPLETRFFDNACSRIIDEWIAGNSRDRGWGFLLDELQDELAVRAHVIGTGGGLEAIHIDLADGWFAWLTHPDGDLDTYDPTIEWVDWVLGLYCGDGVDEGHMITVRASLDELVDRIGPLLRALKT